MPPLDLLTNFPKVNQTKAELKCSYKGRELKKRYVPDLLAFGVLVVEIKAVTELAPEHEAQLFNYMRIARQPVGYLINFGHNRTLEWKRLILSEVIEPGTPNGSNFPIHESSVPFG